MGRRREGGRESGVEGGLSRRREGRGREEEEGMREVGEGGREEEGMREGGERGKEGEREEKGRVGGEG